MYKNMVNHVFVFVCIHLCILWVTGTNRMYNFIDIEKISFHYDLFKSGNRTTKILKQPF